MEGINNSGWLAEDSKHSVHRAKERGGLNKKKALKMMELAKKRGVTSKECTWSIDKNYLEFRTNDECVAVAYNGYCFILERNTMNCVTMYSLPKYFGKKKTFYKSGRSEKSIGTYETACCF